MTYRHWIIPFALLAFNPHCFVQAQDQLPFEAEQDLQSGSLLSSTEELTLHSTVSSAVTYSTDLHPNNSAVSIELFLGDPDDGGVSVAAVEDLSLNGTMYATPTLDATNSGFFQIHSSNLSLADITDFVVDLGVFGGLTLDLVGTNFNFNSGDIPANSTVYSIDDTDLFDVIIDAGMGTLRDPTGTINDVLGSEFPVTLNFAQEPVQASLKDIAGSGVGGTIDLDTGLFTDRGEINLDIPQTTLGFDAIEGVEVFMRISGSVHVAVPEPSGSMLAWAGMICLGAAGYRNRLANSTTA